MTQTQYTDLAVVGLGPAGLAATLAAHAAGIKKIIAMDPASRLGAGNLDGLDILSNSKGSDFTELLPVLFPDAARLAPAIELSTRSELVDLAIAANLLEQVALKAEEKNVVEIVREPVVKAKRLPNGYEIRTPSVVVESDWLAIAPGGREVLIPELAKRNETNSPGSVFTSYEILANKRDEDFEAFISKRNQVAVVGNSHGAYSVAKKLLDKYPGITIDIFKISPTKPFFESVQDAVEHGYNITSIDSICPIRKCINRFDGVKGPARDLWFAEQAGELEGRVRSLLNVPLKEIDLEVAVIQSTGYSQNRVSFFDENDQPIDYVTRPEKDGFARIYTGQNGLVLPRAFALGIGHSSVDATTVYQGQAQSAFRDLR